MSKIKPEVTIEGDMITVKTSNALVVTAGETPAIQPYDTQEKKSGSGLYRPWGQSDTYTRDVLSKIDLHPFLGSVLEYKANTLASGELQYGINEFDETGNKIFKQIEHREIEDFLNANNMEGYRQEILRDLFTWNNSYAGFTRGLERKDKIVELFAFDATECRLEWQNATTGKKDHIYVDANFVNGSVQSPQVKRALIDPYYWNIDDYRNSGEKQFAHYMSFSTSGCKYYQKAAWHSFFVSKWHDVAVKIAQFKSALMDNQMAIRWIIHIPMAWWDWKYPGWNQQKYTAEQKKVIAQKEADKINEILTGPDKAGKALLAVYATDKMGKSATKWEITPVDNKLMSGVYVEDSHEASLMALFALAVHGSVIGNTPGKSQNSAGSGSDIRVASNQFVINNKVYDSKQVEPLRSITGSNKWTQSGKPIVWRVQHNLIQTSNSITPEQRA